MESLCLLQKCKRESETCQNYSFFFLSKLCDADLCDNPCFLFSRVAHPFKPKIYLFLLFLLLKFSNSSIIIKNIKCLVYFLLKKVTEQVILVILISIYLCSMLDVSQNAQSGNFRRQKVQGRLIYLFNSALCLCTF